MNQTTMIYHRLHLAGPQGICAAHITAGLYIGRVAARVHELRQQGHVISTEWCQDEHHQHRAKVARYTLHTDGRL